MATKTWNGASAPFSTDSDWSGGAQPNPGDTAIISAGSVAATGTLIAPLSIKLASSNAASPSLTLTNVVIAPGNAIEVASNVTDATLAIAGDVTNQGSILLDGSSPVLKIGAKGILTTFTNQSGITVSGAGSVPFVSGGSATLVNNGVISFQSSSGSQSDTIFQTVTGTGSLRLDGSVSLTLAAPVGAGQTVAFETGASNLQINSLSSFNGTLQGFSSSDDLTAYGSRWDSDSFTQTATGGVITFSSGGNAISSLNLTGAYTSLADFSIVQTAGTSAFTQTEIKTAVAPPVAPVLFTDTNGGVSGTDAGTAYSGPVSYLQSQFIWGGSDGVALAATSDNMFLHGGVGDDALSAHGGSNVLDGGSGSNFLVGASGADGGTDTFFLDERGGQVTWSTLVNFHKGDALTIFGFTAGTSTMPFTASDGTPGYVGATIHSEIGGAGTGVNGSVTFAAISLADAQAKFTITTGSVGGTTYLSIVNTG